MMRVFWEEWRGGNRYSPARVVPLLLLGVLAALLVTQFQPGAIFFVLVLAGLAGGVLSGTQRWNQVSGRDWVGLEGAAPLSYAVGKVTGFTALAAAWCACLLPPLGLVVLVWAVPLPVVASGLLWVLAGAWGAQALGQAVAWGSGEFQRVTASILVFLWIAGTLQVPLLSPFNPLWQVWTLFHDPERGFDAGAWAGLLACSTLLWVFVIVVLGKTEGRR